MNKVYLGVVIIVILILSGFGFVYLSSKGGQTQDSMTQQTPEDSMAGDAQETDAMKMEGSRYKEYSQSTFASSAGTKRVLFFYANWCPTCRPADANFKANLDKIPEDVTLIRVNYNDSDTDAQEQALADKYGVTYQHTFVQIDENGNPVTRWNGGDISTLLANVKR